MGLMRPVEVIREFRLSKPTLRQWEREGRLTPLFTPGGHRRYDKEEIERCFTKDNPYFHDHPRKDAKDETENEK